MDDPQKAPPLPSPELSGDLPLLPARMVNEFQYCPRLAYLEWGQGEWSESADTVQGRHAPRRVARPRGGYAPERVQLCVQGMILEEHGYVCEEGVLYFVESRERVPVAFDDELRA